MTEEETLTAGLGTFVRHKTRGSKYEVIGLGKVQSGDWKERVLGEDEDGRNAWVNRSVDMQVVVVYRSTQDGSIWVRPRYEFEDGRFERIEGPPAYRRNIAAELYRWGNWMVSASGGNMSDDARLAFAGSDEIYILQDRLAEAVKALKLARDHYELEDEILDIVDAAICQAEGHP